MTLLQKISQARARVEYPIVALEDKLRTYLLQTYYYRVTYPARFWVACGAPAQFRPHLPWWHSFLWRLIVVLGWNSYRGMRRRRR